MTPVPLTTLYSRVRAYAPGVPNPVMAEELRRAARKFCRYTRWLRQTKRIDSVADQEAYALVPEDETLEAINLKAIEYEGEPLTVTRPEEEPHATGQPKRYTFLAPTDLYLFPTPATAVVEGIFVNMILQPKRDVTFLPSTLTNRWDDCLADGALAALLEMPEAQWVNERQALVFADRFLTGMNEARALADMHHRQAGFRSRSYYR